MEESGSTIGPASEGASERQVSALPFAIRRPHNGPLEESPQPARLLLLHHSCSLPKTLEKDYPKTEEDRESWPNHHRPATGDGCD
jgi:hypothetical protein